MTILRRGANCYWHWCPACEVEHPLPDTWDFDGSVVSPTFAPSFRQTSVHWTDGIDDRCVGQGERRQRDCHYFISQGRIQFCPDSWHGRSDIVQMPEIPTSVDGFAKETQD